MSNRRKLRRVPVPADVVARVRADLACPHCPAAIKVERGPDGQLAAKVRHSRDCVSIPEAEREQGNNTYCVSPIVYRMPLGQRGSLN